jgi:hypothetical protein
VDDARGVGISRWLVRLAVVALVVGAVAALRQVAVDKADQEFQTKLRKLDQNRA